MKLMGQWCDQRGPSGQSLVALANVGRAHTQFHRRKVELLWRVDVVETQ